MMENKYKVVKEFGCANKGDILEWDENARLYGLEVSDENGTRALYINEEYAMELLHDGTITFIEDNDLCEDCICASKLNEINDLAKGLILQYDEDFKEVKKKYDNREIPECVYIEAKTVYYNLTKVLNRIKDIIDE